MELSTMGCARACTAQVSAQKSGHWLESIFGTPQTLATKITLRRTAEIGTPPTTDDSIKCSSTLEFLLVLLSTLYPAAKKRSYNIVPRLTLRPSLGYSSVAPSETKAYSNRNNDFVCYPTLIQAVLACRKADAYQY